LPAATGPDGGVIVVEGRHGSLAGFASYRSVYFFEDGAPRCRITALTVDEGARRSGVAGVLLEEVERRARSHGCTEIEVASARRPERDAAHHLYPAAGFEDATSTVGFYSRRLHF
jgi:GNAT superfamily N-acetyltransferase